MEYFIYFFFNLHTQASDMESIDHFISQQKHLLEMEKLSLNELEYSSKQNKIDNLKHTLDESVGTDDEDDLPKYGSPSQHVGFCRPEVSSPCSVDGDRGKRHFPEQVRVHLFS